METPTNREQIRATKSLEEEQRIRQVAKKTLEYMDDVRNAIQEIVKSLGEDWKNKSLSELENNDKVINEIQTIQDRLTSSHLEKLNDAFDSGETLGTILENLNKTIEALEETIDSIEKDIINVKER